jgi:DNA-binding Xre family transcriptional regulator
MKKGEAITTKTMDTFCFILDCTVPEILEYEKPE